jgi:S1-C subfamily serine protease
MVAGTSSDLVHIGATAFLGVEVEAAGSANSFGSSSKVTSGAEIAGVASGSPAAAAGLGIGDTIVAIDGQKVSSPSALSKDMLKEKPGAKVQFVYVGASGQQETVTATLASGPPQ